MEQGFMFRGNGPTGKREAFLEYLSAMLKDEDDLVSVMANASAAIKEAFGYLWVGFYLAHEDGTLHLGPFQGPVACSRIGKGKGVCGKCWEDLRTQVVPDVEKVPYHIACSSLSRSEVVVPLIQDGQFVGVMDIDSQETGTFQAQDAPFFERLAAIITSIKSRP